MNINLEVHLTIMTTMGPNRITHGGSFEVNNREYKEDPEFAVAVAAYKFIEQIRKETGHMDTVIDKVILDGQHDITKVVRQIRPVVDDNLPF